MTPRIDTVRTLSQINETLANLGISSRIHALTDLPAHCEIPARFCPCLLLDDSTWVFETYVEPLILTTDSQAQFIRHDKQTINELVAAVKESGAKLLLLDGNLAEGLKGWQLLQLILEECPDLICIGFSNDWSLESHFTRAGAKGFAKKKLDQPFESLQAVVKELERLKN